MTKSFTILKDPLEWKRFCGSLKAEGSLGFIPTMGALHKGHGSLIGESLNKDHATVVSIFVNPLQFNDKNDYDNYPRDYQKDTEYLSSLGVAGVFLPSEENLYPEGPHYKVCEDQLSRLYCGAFRPGHFDGVLTVVLKLLMLTGADRAYFGEKDFQQLLLIQGMVKEFYLETQIIPVKIFRETSGLAMSSRNQRLSKKGKEKASEFYQILKISESKDQAKDRLESMGFKTDYVEDLVIKTEAQSVRRLAAVWLEGVRLIDNIEVPDSLVGCRNGR